MRRWPSELSKVVQVGPKHVLAARPPTTLLLLSKVAPDKGFEAEDQAKKAEKLQCVL